MHERLRDLYRDPVLLAQHGINGMQADPANHAVDAVVPRALGGQYVEQNVADACLDCNTLKSLLDVGKFLEIKSLFIVAVVHATFIIVNNIMTPTVTVPDNQELNEAGDAIIHDFAISRPNQIMFGSTTFFRRNLAGYDEVEAVVLAVYIKGGFFVAIPPL